MCQKIISLLCAVVLLASISLTVCAEGEAVVVPQRVKKLADRLPTYEAMPAVRMVDQLIQRQLHRLITMKDPDATLYVTWEAEGNFFPVELTGGKAVLEVESPSNFDLYVEKGPWVGTYRQNGECIGATKSEKNTDYFKLGKPDAYGYVLFSKHDEKHWYASEVAEYYPEGEIASCTASYNWNGELIHYWLGYRKDKQTVYDICYSADDQPIYGVYGSIDEWGNVMSAIVHSRKSWIEPVTGLLTRHPALDWELPDLVSFVNPPRKLR